VALQPLHRLDRLARVVAADADHDRHAAGHHRAVRSTIRSVSSSSMVGLSPVVPSGFTPVTPIFT
jgi:hypothetical protein